MRALTRRGFLALSAGGLVTACGGSGGGGSSTASGASGSVVAVRYFPDGIHAAGRPERLPFGLAGSDGVPLSDGPPTLAFTVTDAAGKVVAEGEASRHGDGIPRPYYPVELDLPAAGVYTLAGRTALGPVDAAIRLAAPGSVRLPGAGDRMPPFDTPTVADARGVDPLCTREQPCPFHGKTLTEALAAGRPVAYLVGTPAHCQTGICGPVLDLLIAQATDFPGTVVHAEVFADPDGRQVAPAVKALGLDFEPLLFVIGADGVVRRRLDVIYDAAELRSALAGTA
jgi:hypothetical protein